MTTKLQGLKVKFDFKYVDVTYHGFLRGEGLMVLRPLKIFFTYIKNKFSFEFFSESSNLIFDHFEIDIFNCSRGKEELVLKFWGTTPLVIKILFSKR
jgi:hypothetical protein